MAAWVPISTRAHNSLAQKHVNRPGQNASQVALVYRPTPYQSARNLMFPALQGTFKAITN